MDVKNTPIPSAAGSVHKRGGIGNRIAPPRFIAYVVLVIIAAIVAAWQPWDQLIWFMAGYDLATILFLASLLPLALRDHHAATIARHARDNDAGRPMILAISVMLSFAVIAIVAAELSSALGAPQSWAIAIVLVTLLLTWLSGNVIFALHYAHLYYSAGDKRGPYAAGLDFHQSEDPDYWDFLHFSLILGMTFQTADIDIESRKIRRISTWHSLAAFIFNIGILAFTINIIASSGGAA